MGEGRHSLGVPISDVRIVFQGTTAWKDNLDVPDRSRIRNSPHEACLSVVARSCCTQHPLIPASARAVITRHTRIKLACSPHVITRNGPRNPPFWRQPCAPGLQQRRRRPTSSDRAPKLQKTPVMIAGSGPRLLMPRKKWQTGSGSLIN